MDMGGQEHEILRDGKTAGKAMGLKNTERPSGKSYIGFSPETDVRVGDILIAKFSENRLQVSETDVEVIRGQPFQRKAFVVNLDHHEVSKERAGAVFNIGSVHSSIVGSQGEATLNMNFDLKSVIGEIENRGGPDSEELKAIVTEIQRTLETERVIPKGFLGKSWALLERNSWVIEPIMKSLLEWLSKAS